MPAGRPSDYSIELAERLCERIASPMSMKKACEPDDMPTMATVFKWLGKHEEFRERYARATDERTEAQAEEMLDIADDKDADPKRSRLMVDTRKWLMAKMKPKKYGEKVTTEHTGAVEYVVRMPEPTKSIDEWLQQSSK